MIRCLEEGGGGQIPGIPDEILIQNGQICTNLFNFRVKIFLIPRKAPIKYRTNIKYITLDISSVMRY